MSAVTGWQHGELLAIDFETTGVDPATCAPVTLAIARIRPDLPLDMHAWLLNPGCDIPEGATAIHGITTEQARDEGEDPAEILDMVAGDIALALRRGAALVAYNASYDCTVLEHTLTRLGRPTVADRLGQPLAPVIDPFVLDKHLDKYRRGSRKLVDTARHYGVVLTDEDAHGAEADALAAARVAWCIARDYPDVAELDVLELHAAQVGWAAAQAASLQAYFRRQSGRQGEVVDGQWPVRALPAAVAS